MPHHRTTTTTTTTMLRLDGEKGGYGQVVGPNDACLGQVCFFFFILFFLLTYIYYLRVNRPTDPPSLQKRVGGPFYDSRTPPSLQVRVGGVFFHYSTHGPTLATNASRWAVFTQEITPIPHPRTKRESVGVFFTLYLHGPTLAANASRWAVFTQEHTPYPTLTPNASRWGLILYYSCR